MKTLKFLFFLIVLAAGCGHNQVNSSVVGNSPSRRIDSEKIRKVVKSHLGDVKKCYELGLTSTPGLFGKVVVLWTIGEDGKVIKDGITSSTLKSSEVENCMILSIKDWIFPSPPKGETAEISYPFIFQDREKKYDD